MAESDNVLTKLQDLLLYVVPQLDKFPRSQKFVLGDRIETKLLEVQEHCLRAYYSRDKRSHLLEANMTLEITRHLVRLAHSLRHFSHHTYAVLAEKMDEVGRMIGGWLRSLSVGGNGRGLVEGNRRSADIRVGFGAGVGAKADKNVGAPTPAGMGAGSGDPAYRGVGGVGRLPSAGAPSHPEHRAGQNSDPSRADVGTRGAAP